MTLKKDSDTLSIVCFRMDQHEKADMERECQRRDITMSQVMRKLFWEQLEKYQRED